MSDIIVALIGATTSIIVAIITTIKSANHDEKIRSRTPLFISILALGLAITGIIIGVFSFSGLGKPQILLAGQKFTAHTSDYEPKSRRC